MPAADKCNYDAGKEGGEACDEMTQLQKSELRCRFDHRNSESCAIAPYDCEILYLLSNCILYDTHVVGYSSDDGCSGQVSVKGSYLLVEDRSQKC